MRCFDLLTGISVVLDHYAVKVCMFSGHFHCSFLSAKRKIVLRNLALQRIAKRMKHVETILRSKFDYV